MRCEYLNFQSFGFQLVIRQPTQNLIHDLRLAS